MAIVKEQLQPAYIEVQRKLDDAGTFNHASFLVKDQQSATFLVPPVVRFIPSAPSNFGYKYAGVNVVSAPLCNVQ